MKSRIIFKWNLFRSNSDGVAAAALNYFDKSLDNLDLSEAALAALPKA